MKDHRYDYVMCAKCGQRWQLIDWGSAAHAYFCEAGKSPPFDAAAMIATWQSEDRIAAEWAKAQSMGPPRDWEPER
jgi:hypothetical protein